MEIINYSAEPVNKLYSWLPRNLKAEQIVFLPDACPGKSTLATLCLDFVDWILRIGDGWQSWNEWRKVNAEIRKRKKIPERISVYLAVMD